MTRRSSIDERYPLRVANPLRAVSACHRRLGEIVPELEAQRTATAELVEIARQLEACALLILKAHDAEGGAP